MKTFATDKLTQAYLQKLERQNYIATAVVLLIIIVSTFWMAFTIGGVAVTGNFSNSVYPVAELGGALCAGITGCHARYGPLRLGKRHQLAWLLIALGLCSDGLGGIYFAYLGANNMSVTPSAADIGFTLFYPCVFAGLVLMPTALRFRKRVILDSLITTLCILGVSWFYAIGPAYLAQEHTPELLLQNFFSLSYPFWDMLLILAIVLLIQRHTEKILHPSLMLCAVGIIFITWADTIYAYQSNRYVSGTVYIDPFWFLGAFIIGLAALYQYTTLARRAYTTKEHPLYTTLQAEQATSRHSGTFQRNAVILQSCLTYLPLIFLLILVVYSEVIPDNGISLFLVILAAIVGILVAFRYVLATYENEMLLRERKQQNEEAEHLRRMMTQLSDIFELDALLERIVSLSISEFNFDTAILLLREKHTGVLIYAATADTPKPVLWQFQESDLHDSLILTDKALELSSSSYREHLPVTMQQWLQKHGQQQYPTLFVPLIYQEQHLGNLGFSSCTHEHFSQHDTDISRAFAAQVAVILEHTRLYQMAREREAFAQAMANIATRLNAAAVVPTEIHHLICREGAHALQADYAILYGATENGRFIPYATYTHETEPPATILEWPPISKAKYEGEARTLNTMQPILLQFDVPVKQKSMSPSTGIYASHATQPLEITGRHPGIQTIHPSQQTDSFVTLLRNALGQRYVQTAILAPLVSGGKSIGWLILARSMPPGTADKKTFDTEDLSHAQGFAEQAAVAFTNAQLYQHIQTAHQRLKELDQLKDQFIVTASHELRTPLTAVQGYVELLTQYGEILPAEQRKEFLYKAQRSCDELVVLLGNVMDASRLEIEAGIRSAHLASVPVKETIQNIIEILEPQIAQEQREVQLHIPPHCAVLADAARLRQVLRNICGNALKYSPRGSPIIISAHSHVKRPDIVISVQDKGRGVPMYEQVKLFERFYRLERDVNSPVRGSGLGLYISRRLIEAMGGTIWIESSGIPGEGSTFHIQLPMA